MAFLLAPLILAYFMLLGVACASLVARRVPTPIVLVSPSMGVGILLALALSLNRLGLPVASFGLALSLGLGIAAAICVAWRRPHISWDELRDLAPPVAAGLLLAGAPIIVFGLQWAANANPDMGLYINSAANFLRHGFFDVPDLGALRSNADAARNAWFWEVLPPNRYGADMLIALAAAVFRVPTYEIYMVVQAASFAALVCTTGALVGCGSRLKTYVTAALFAVATPLMLYTIYQQLLPQMLGQVALVGVVALVQTTTRGLQTYQRGVALGCTAVALLLIYPEIAPFLALAGIVWAPFALYVQRRELRALAAEAARVAASALAAVLVLLNVQIFTVLATLGVLFAIGATVTVNGIGAINYYLVPSGLANLWGFAPFDGFGEPWLTVGIIAGFIAFVAVLLASAWSLRRGRYSDAMALALLLFSLYLFHKRSSYGLFKLAFLLQPVLVPYAASAVIAAGEYLRTRFGLREPWGVAAALTAAIATTSATSAIYLGTTSDAFAKLNANYTELHAASTHRLYAQLDAIERTYRDTGAQVPFTSDVLLPNLATLEGAAFAGHPLSFLTLDPYSNLFGMLELKVRLSIPGWSTEARRDAIALAKERRKLFQQQRFTFERKSIGAHLPVPNAPRPDGVFIQTGPGLSILNRSASPGEFDVRAVPVREVRNWLCLVDSDLGFPPFTKLRTYAIGPVEPDPFARTNTVATVGTSMLLEVFNGDPAVRLRLDVTGTLNPGRVTDLPPITVTGTSTVRLGELGSGAARLESPPVRPFTAFGHRYVVVRFGSRLLHFVTPRSWIMQLFGRDVDIEPRLFALYARDISIAGPPQPAPSTVSRFPNDVLNRSLLFSGIYEDGWMSGTVRARLRSEGAGFFRLRVNVPPGLVDHYVSVSIDGRPVKDLIARPATYVDFQVRSPGQGDHDVAVAASGLSAISADDSRQTWGKIEAFGFQSDITGAGIQFRDDRQWYPFETYQDRTFRWTKRVVALRIAPSASRRLLRLDVAPGPSAGGPVDLAVSAGGKVTRAHVAREQEIDAELPPSSQPLDVVLSRPSGSTPVPSDPRDLTLRVFSATVTTLR